MSFSSGFRGTVGGSVQANYTDQPGVGVAGMLAFSSDVNLSDAVYIGEVDGIGAGLGVIYDDVDGSISLQRPSVAAILPDLNTLAGDFQGITVFDEQMQSDENGVPGWANGRMGRVLRNVRNGGRIYVNTPEAIDHLTDDVYLQIVAQAPFAVGEFGPTAAVGESILIQNAKWVTSSVAGGVAIIELLG